MIARPQYLDKLLQLKDKDFIKVITGVRRCGKSTILKIFQNNLRKNGITDKQIISINFEDMNNSDLLDANSLHNYLDSKISPESMTYIFLDEVQLVEGFQRVADSIFIRENTDLYITGSNSNLLSGELATLLSGRYVELKMLPLSFKEYCSYWKPVNIDAAFSSYLEKSSFPYAATLSPNETIIDDYLEGILNTIIIKDIAERKNISDVTLLKRIIEFVFDNIGNIVSVKKISDSLSSNGFKISSPTVDSYLTALRESFIIYEVKRYDIKGKRYLQSLEKDYVVDIGLRYTLLGNKGIDIGYILENIIYLELLRRGYSIFIGKTNSYEIDFIALQGSERKYIQVAASVRNQQTLERELRPLQAINDHYTKFILTLDRDPSRDYDGIEVKNALDFLLE